ncbi:type II toxin-antitoxin system RelE/ParE family toxin [Thiotrichales bacterium 19S9-12]|nr:type II toxin-antitoxin system RelE/ParE family toxin [Thiotrichales bacterium 19S9-11]MCF6810976.1 type II toxin-antitoxin system RelE/ParE family toxin [Thiotrichales bacterium 19S9-12]
MNLKVKQTNVFKKAIKKLPKQHKTLVDQAVKSILKDPNLGEKKKGDLSFLRVYKFKINRQEMLLGYHFEENELVLTLLQLSSHENFYRDIRNKT